MQAFRPVETCSRACLRSCKQGAGLAITITHFLPTWLSQRMISAWFTSTPLCGPELLLKIYRVVDFRKDPSVKAVTCGRLEDLQTLLATGTISPYIISQYDHSLLHVCQSSYKLPKLRPLLTTTCTDSLSRCSHQICHSTITSRDGTRSKPYRQHWRVSQGRCCIEYLGEINQLSYMAVFLSQGKLLLWPAGPRWGCAPAYFSSWRCRRLL